MGPIWVIVRGEGYPADRDVELLPTYYVTRSSAEEEAARLLRARAIAHAREPDRARLYAAFAQMRASNIAPGETHVERNARADTYVAAGLSALPPPSEEMIAAALEHLVTYKHSLLEFEVVELRPAPDD